jgi:hypothetical protein
MKFFIHLVAESEAGQHVQEIAYLERKEDRLEEVGLTLREAKKLLGAIQQKMKKALEQREAISDEDYAKVKGLASIVKPLRSVLDKTPDNYGMTG